MLDRLLGNARLNIYSIELLSPYVYMSVCLYMYICIYTCMFIYGERYISMEQICPRAGLCLSHIRESGQKETVLDSDRSYLEISLSLEVL